jgi:hypothetical protein
VSVERIVPVLQPSEIELAPVATENVKLLFDAVNKTHLKLFQAGPISLEKTVILFASKFEAFTHALIVPSVAPTT